MKKGKIMLSLLIVSCGFITACAQQDKANQPEQATDAELQTVEQTNASIHPYGGWYCPDNLRGFPPVNVVDLAKIPVVNGRMPTKDETRNGTSLMYFDPAEYPTAKPVDITLPKLAHYYSPQTRQTELVIVIQAVIVDTDTVVGFRYLNGGNGTSWYNEVDFLTDKEAAEIGSTPFVFLEAEINASKEKIWEAFTKTEYAQSLGKRFGEEAFFNAPWTNGSRVKLNLDVPGEKAHGYVMTLFGNLYLQIDYDMNGRHTVEKLLVMDTEDGNSKLQFVFGPYIDDYGSQEIRWQQWLEEVKTLSEAQ
ncbi:hypothetical protein Oweho_2438 [Owenweeksia hongkongensis DSM 17368]|uniref:Lipoprotein n=1 Tax=Owenweeksia hongkongensis (strain DSM 17368 / CIP 108786 / JCM 12287 / NRRL B-23963 / UST20020801) TaxID=926562 RepID=G8R743_OWEHD|nr:hypothetical protein [Owenweeksia hongkongensis]AEV33408.1 hypothetical protein Oweho_2438 [Owenweeksia hongkongensis DSM 17368]